MSENKNINQEIIEEEYMLGKEYYSKILLKNTWKVFFFVIE